MSIEQIITELNNKQKDYLKKLFDERDLICLENMELKEWRHFESLKNYQKLYNDAERYLRQLYWDNEEKKKFYREIHAHRIGSLYPLV